MKVTASFTIYLNLWTARLITWAQWAVDGLLILKSSCNQQLFFPTVFPLINFPTAQPGNAHGLLCSPINCPAIGCKARLNGGYRTETQSTKYKVVYWPELTILYETVN